VDSISADGKSADISVTYAAYHSLGTSPAYIADPHESYVHHITCT
jgi:hypothetical protein